MLIKYIAITSLCLCWLHSVCAYQCHASLCRTVLFKPKLCCVTVYSGEWMELETLGPGTVWLCEESPGLCYLFTVYFFQEAPSPLFICHKSCVYYKTNPEIYFLSLFHCKLKGTTFSSPSQSLTYTTAVKCGLWMIL